MQPKAYMIGVMNAEYNFRLKKAIALKGLPTQEYSKRKKMRPIEVYSRKQIDAYELGYRSTYAAMRKKYVNGELEIKCSEFGIE